MSATPWLACLRLGIVWPYARPPGLVTDDYDSCFPCPGLYLGILPQLAQLPWGARQRNALRFGLLASHVMIQVRLPTAPGLTQHRSYPRADVQSPLGAWRQAGDAEPVRESGRTN